MDAGAVRSLLLSRIGEQRGARSKWAKDHDVAASYVSMVLSGDKEPGDKILSALGLERRVSYEPQEEDHGQQT